MKGFESIFDERLSSLNKEVAMTNSDFNQKHSKVMDYIEALNFVRNELGDKLQEKKRISDNTLSVGIDVDAKKGLTKEDLRKRIKQTESDVEDIVYEHNFGVRDFMESSSVAGSKDVRAFVKEVTQDLVGYSILSDAFADPEISDIFIMSWDNIYVEKRGVNVPYHRKFYDKNHYDDVVKRFVGESGKEINAGDKKIVDFELYGDRGVAIEPSVATKGYAVAMRKHSEDQITMKQVVEGGVMTQEIADLLGYVIEGETNLIYAGITGTGKTTTLRAVLDHYVQNLNKRMLVVEDTQELFPKNEHTVELLSFKSEELSSRVSLNDLIITALRMKPKYIVVGEVRGEEAQAAVESMETGHSTLFSMHGGEPWNIINRLVTKYLMAMPSLGIDVVERIIGSAVDYICIQDDIPNVGRRMTSMVEVSYNFETNRVDLTPIIEFDVINNQFNLINYLSPVKVKNMLRRGLDFDKISKWTEATKEDLYAVEGTIGKKAESKAKAEEVKIEEVKTEDTKDTKPEAISETSKDLSQRLKQIMSKEYNVDKED